jgi:hypothetical protein
MLGGLFGGKQDAKALQKTFEENVSQLEQRISVVQQGLIRCGVRTVQLSTEEAVELFYKIFNPGEMDKATNILLQQQKIGRCGQGVSFVSRELQWRHGSF